MSARRLRRPLIVTLLAVWPLTAVFAEGLDASVEGPQDPNAPSMRVLVRPPAAQEAPRVHPGRSATGAVQPMPEPAPAPAPEKKGFFGCGVAAGEGTAVGAGLLAVVLALGLAVLRGRRQLASPTKRA